MVVVNIVGMKRYASPFINNANDVENIIYANDSQRISVYGASVCYLTTKREEAFSPDNLDNIIIPLIPWTSYPKDYNIDGRLLDNLILFAINYSPNKIEFDSYYDFAAYLVNYNCRLIGDMNSITKIIREPTDFYYSETNKKYSYTMYTENAILVIAPIEKKLATAVKNNYGYNIIVQNIFQKVIIKEQIIKDIIL